MTRQAKDLELDTRLRALIDQRFGDRGRFALLEETSGIAAHRWKNFFYRRQSATEEMINFWRGSFPEDVQWLTTGVRAPGQNEFPFSAPIPNLGPHSTVAQRLAWVIAEWASPTGEALFKWLEQQSHGRIPAGEWAKVLLMRTAEPTVEMIQVGCWERRMFLEWVIYGAGGFRHQVNPDNQASVARWVESGEGFPWVLPSSMEKS